MDTTDRWLLNLIQKDFPLTEQPFEFLAKQLGVSEAEVLKRVNRLMKAGIIRRVGGSFNSGKLGYTSTLCAMKVDPDKVQDTVGVINGYPQVTHNYLRKHEFNIWFTIIAESEAKVTSIIEEIKAKTGQRNLMNLPAIRVFKLDVNFSLEEVSI